MDKYFCDTMSELQEQLGDTVRILFNEVTSYEYADTEFQREGLVCVKHLIDVYNQISVMKEKWVEIQ